MRIRFKGLIVTAGALLLMSAPKAYGAMSWELLMQVTGGDNVDITSDGTAAGTHCTSSLGAAVCAGLIGTGSNMVFSGALDTYNVNVQVATSVPSLTLPEIMDLGSTLHGTGAQIMTVKYAVQGLTNPPVGPAVMIGSTSFDPLATVNAYYDALNGNTVGSTVPAGVNFQTITDNVITGGAVNVTGTYSLTELLTFQGTFLSSDVHLNTVPEPASVALLGGVLLFTANMLRRKQKRA